MAWFSSTRQRFFVPEVVQTSAMDCGPASLKSLLEGFGISASYGRLREACQTDVDGTSIDTLEEVAIQLGLQAEQVMIPPDHLLHPQAKALPALVVVRLPSGITHFVVAWRCHGRFIQIMDPATGRRWSTRSQFVNELYIHEMPVAASDWREWAGSQEFVSVLRLRLQALGIASSTMTQRISQAQADPGWLRLASLDASARALDAMVRAGGLSRGRQATRVFETLCDRTQENSTDPTSVIPAAYWSARPLPPTPPATAASDEQKQTVQNAQNDQDEQVLLRGAVLIQVQGRAAEHSPDAGKTDAQLPPLSPELLAALAEAPSRPGRELLRLIRADGLLAPTVLLSALALAAGGVVLEAVLFRGLFDLGRELGLTWQRFSAMAAVLTFGLALLVLELPLISSILRFGRRLEVRLRIAFLEKIPRLGDRYFQSRLTSDMAERSHTVQKLRLLPELGGQLIRQTCELVLTTLGIIWLDPASAPLVLLAAGLTVGLPLLAQPVLMERDLRVRSHAGALSRFYLDALLGLVTIRAHGAERAVRREHEELLDEWRQANLGLQRSVVGVEALQSVVGFGLAGWLVLGHLGQGGDIGGVLLLVYWALNIPVMGQEIGLITRQYPAQRSATLRLLEPLGAPEEADSQTELSPASSALTATAASSDGHSGVAIGLHGVSVRAAGHTILDDIDLTIPAGGHVAIVGQSGAGKSSLAGLLLGWHRPASGAVLIDDDPLDTERLARLRRETAWVDPAIQLWNRPLLDNLEYGLDPSQTTSIGQIIQAADLRSVLEKMPDGMQTTLGEGGGLVSGGEGQRVRLGRALLRPDTRLVILDEPFRGLDRNKRRALLGQTRQWWKDTTLLCITHDVGETQTFERVLVIDNGHIAEDGNPAELMAQPDSMYRSLREAEDAVRQGLWSSTAWRRIRLESGCLEETVSNGNAINAAE